jgi:hypothetical protein
MKRRTLDIMFSVGGLALAGLLLVMGLVLTSNSNFAKNYTRDQLAAQKITFKEASALTAEEKAAPCLTKYGGQLLTTGAQAECYANNFIGLHVKTSGGGKTYSEIGDVQTGLRNQIKTATAANDPNLAGLQKQLTDATAQRETVFKGETLKGLLLTSYGFSVFGDKGGQAANVSFLVGGLMLILSLAGLLHAYKTPRSKGFAMPNPVVDVTHKVLVDA